MAQGNSFDMIDLQGSHQDLDAIQEAELAEYLLSVEEMEQEVAEACAETLPLPASPQVSERTFGGGSTLSLSAPSSKGKSFVVFNGRQVGIFNDWNTVAVLVNGFSGACYASYPTHAEAEKAWENAKHANLTGLSPRVGTRSANPIGGSAPSPFAHNSTTLAFSPLYTRHNPFSTSQDNIVRLAPACPPPYVKQTTPARKSSDGQGNLVRGKTPIKVEELTPRMPRTAPGSPFVGGCAPIACPPASSPLAGGNPRLPTASPLAGYSQVPIMDMLMPYKRDENNWWVVVVGNRPGIYCGKANALKHAGLSEDVQIFECLDGVEQAREVFVDAFAGHFVRSLASRPSLTYQPAPFALLPFIRNDPFWYVVPMGPAPGVYEGRRTASRMAGRTIEHMFCYESERSAYRMFVELYMSFKIQETVEVQKGSKS